MAEKKEPTRKQHYIPQEHLRGFSQDSKTIYEYNIKKSAAIKTPVPIESVCREKDLYELYDSQGQIVNVNYLEDILCTYEGRYAEFRRQLLKKAKLKDNYRTKCFLTKEEKQFWYFYTALQVVRIPSILQGTAEILQEAYPGHLTENAAANLAREYCLPFFTPPEKEDENSLLAFLYLLAPKSISVCYTPSDRLFTSDAAVYGYSPKDVLFDFETLWFPICSCVSLLFSDPKTQEKPMSNRLLPMDEKTVDDLNKGIACIAHNMVFSKHPFTEKDIEIIQDARLLEAERTHKYEIIKKLGDSIGEPNE